MKNLVTVEIEIHTPDDPYVGDIELLAEEVERQVSNYVKEWASDYKPKLQVSVDYTTQYEVK